MSRFCSVVRTLSSVIATFIDEPKDETVNIERSIVVNATPQAILEYLTSPQYISDLDASRDNRTTGIINVTEVGRTVNDGLLTDQIIRYEATTRLPGFLKKYEAKAPETISWRENVHWEHTRYLATFNIIADAPSHWQERYTSIGKLTLIALEEGTRLVRELDFKINVFGLGKIIERALSSEIETLFDARNKLIHAHFE